MKLSSKSKKIENQPQPWLLTSKIEDQPRPLLLIRYGYHIQRLVLYSPDENRYHKVIADDMHYKMIYPTNIAEWFVIKDMESPECRLWNMTTLDTIQLPDLIEDEENREYIAQFVLDKPPDKHDCHIIFLNEDTRKAWFCKLGEDANFLLIDVNTGDGVLRSAAFFQGSFLLMTMGGILFEVKLGDVSAQCTRLVSCESIRDLQLRTFSNKVHLIEPRGDDELFLIVRVRAGTLKYTDSMVVFRMNFSHGEREWVTVKDIGNKAFFISESGRALSWTPNISGLKGNCIYYVLPYDTKLYIFDLEDESTSSWDLCYIMTNYNSKCDWISY